jgi:hypothetical protein
VKQVEYIIHDADRLDGFDAPLVATTDDKPLVDAIDNCMFDCNTLGLS